MKLDLAAKIKKHKMLAILVLCAVICALGAGGYFGWKQYQYWQSSQYAFTKIQAALNPPDAAKLAKMVNFRAIANDLSQAIQHAFPFYMTGPDQEQNISHALQTALLKRFMTKEEKKQQTLVKEDEEALLRKDLTILPDDFLSQLPANLHLTENGPSSALISAKIDHPLLNQPFTLVFNLANTAEGWKISHLVNAGEITSQLRKAMLERHARVVKMYKDKNAATAKVMNELLPLQSCTAHAGMLSDGRTMLMVIHVIARNRGNVQINNFNLDASFLGRSGQFITKRYLNASKPVAPGEDFNHRWSLELSGTDPVAQSLLRDQPLQCRAVWQTLTLNNGKVLHIVEEPYKEGMCEVDGHHHPTGFCLSPVFLN